MEKLDQLEGDFSDLLRERVSSDPEQAVTVCKDSQFTENPLERDNMEERLTVSQVKSFQQLYHEVKMTGGRDSNLLVRVPVAEESAPREDCIDMLVESLKQEPASTQCVFSCQAGQGRTTLGMIIACQVKEIQISTELRKMAELGLIPQVRSPGPQLVRVMTANCFRPPRRILSNRSLSSRWPRLVRRRTSISEESLMLSRSSLRSCLELARPRRRLIV